MKNFRKVLALILVVATLFSFTAMASAIEYKDADKISADYEVAVDVLSAIGILNGYPDETFQPAKNIEREEMAKMVAVLSNAGDDVSELYASACTFADSKNSWAASYIAYCTQTGIVAGRSATTFDPNANVTGLETAKMLLCVLGFDAAEQGYVGSNWKVNVLRDAKNFGLLNGFAAGYDVSKAITREEAAQMFLNALQANIVVGTISDNIIKVSNAIYLTENFPVINLTLKDAEKYGYDWIVVYGNVVISKTPLASIYKGLALDEADRDCYGNPCRTWTYSDSKGKVLFSKSYAVAPDLKYTTAASLVKDLDSEIKSSVHDYTVEAYVDGMLLDVDHYLADWAADKSYSLANFADEFTGNGVLTQVYVDDVDHHVVITVKNTYIGEVAYITKQANTFTLTSGATFSNKGYGFQPGDMILYWICNGDKAQYTASLHGAKIVEPLSVTVSRTTTVGGDPAKSTLTADGTKYEYAENFCNDAYSTDWLGTRTKGALFLDNLADPYFNLYLDEYGYIMLYRYDAYEYEYSYFYAVEGTAFSKITGEDGRGNVLYESSVDVVDFDAKYTEDLAVDRALYDVSVANANMYGREWDKKGVGALVETYNYDDVEYLSDVAAFASVGATLTKNGNIINTVAELDFSEGRWYESGPEVTLYGTEETKYLVRTWDYDKGEYIYTAFTGRLDQDYVGYVYNYFYGNRTTEPKRIPTIQYFMDDEGFLSYVFVDAVFTTTAQRAFVTGTKEAVSDVKFFWQIGAVDYYTAIINGQESLLAVTDNRLLPGAGQFDASFPFLYEAKLQCIGLTDEGVAVYSVMDPITPTTTYQAYRWYKGILQVVEPGKEGNVYRIADDCFAVVTVKKSDGTLSTKVLESVEDINDYFESLLSIENESPADNYLPVNGWIITKSGEAAEIYIVVD